MMNKQDTEGSEGRQHNIARTVLDEYHIIDGPEPDVSESRHNNERYNPVDTETLCPENMVVSESSSDNEAVHKSTDELRSAAQQKESAAEARDGIAAVSTEMVQSPTLPHVNCPEKIMICLDVSQEMSTTTFKSRSGEKYSGLDLARRAIKMFVMHKSQMNPKHEFSLLVFREEPTMIQSMTSKAQDILNTLDESEIETQESAQLNLSSLFETIKENVELPVALGDSRVIPPPYIVRVLLFYGRSQSVPISSCQKAQKELESCPYYFTDVLYIHDPPSEENKCEEIFKALCELDHTGLSYILEQSKYTQVLNSGAKLMAHPLQRPRQMDALYRISSLVPQAHSQDERS